MATVTQTPHNVFAEAVTQTMFKVTNNSGGHLGNQFILVFLTPIESAENYLYAAWQQLNPGEGGTSPFVLNQTVSGMMLTTNGTTTNLVEIDPGYVSIATNPDGLQPQLGQQVLGATLPPPTVTPTQSGLVNNTAGPGYALYAQWFINNNLAIQSKAPVAAGGTLSAFELNTTLYWAVGDTVVGPTYTYNQITPMTAYSLPPATPIVSVSLTYNTTSNTFGFTFEPASHPN